VTSAENGLSDQLYCPNHWTIFSTE